MRKKIELVHAGSLSTSNTVISIMIIALFFFIFGFTTWINAILIPYFKISCELNYSQSLLVAFAFCIAYFVMAIPAAQLLEKVAFKNGIMIGFWIMALGALIFVPAALTGTIGLFFLWLFSIGTRLTILQPAANTYITMIGSKERAAQRMSIMGVCNKSAGIIAPLLLAAAILRSTDTDLFRQLPFMDEVTRNAALDELIRRVIVPYASMSVALFGLGLMIRYSILPEIDTNNENATVADANPGKTSINDGFHLNKAEVQCFYKMKGVENTILVSDALDLAGLPPGEYTRGERVVLLTPDVVKFPVENCLAGAATPISACVSNIMKFTDCSLGNAIKMASSNPARLLGLNEIGEIKQGKRADLILFTIEDGRIEIQKTIVAGKIVYSNN
jgi:hypothetical protein